MNVVVDGWDVSIKNEGSTWIVEFFRMNDSRKARFCQRDSRFIDATPVDGLQLKFLKMMISNEIERIKNS